MLHFDSCKPWEADSNKHTNANMLQYLSNLGYA